jgi:hypothetical protein
MGPVMLRWFLVLVLAVVSTTAQAQAPTLLERTTQAWNASVSAERRVAQLAAQRTALVTRWQTELAAVDRLKQSRSWNRDRQLREKLSETNELGKQLETLTAELGRAQGQLAFARRTLVAAIDTELAAGPNTARTAQLQKARAQVSPSIASAKAHRIVLPALKIDPLADPEELEQQAKALRESELELQKQIKGLELQTKELERVAMLHKHNNRTREMDRRDDNSSRKTANGGDRGTGAAAPEDAGPNPTTDGMMFEMDITIVLVEIVDQPTIDSLKSAQRSGDPKARAEALKRAREGALKKAAQMRSVAKQAEDKAKQLRGGR